MKSYEQFYTCLDEVFLLKLLQIFAISIQFGSGFTQDVKNFYLIGKKASGPAFASAKFVMILLFFWLKFDVFTGKRVCCVFEQ